MIPKAIKERTTLSNNRGRMHQKSEPVPVEEK
jgi:hypothetical protein